MSKSKIHPHVPEQKNQYLYDRAVQLKDNGGNHHLLHQPSKLTVWKRSSMSFQGMDGFTVFDDRGRLVFRVDNYSRNNLSSVLLMDGRGNPLVMLKPKRWSMQKQWNAYVGDEDNNHHNRLFSMKRAPSAVGAFQSMKPSSKTEAEVLMGHDDGGRWIRSSENSSELCCSFRVDGEFKRRRCEIVRVRDGQVVAKIGRKTNSTVELSDEVFSLELLLPSHELPPALLMAFVIVLDRI